MPRSGCAELAHHAHPADTEVNVSRIFSSPRNFPDYVVEGYGGEREHSGNLPVSPREVSYPAMMRV